VAGQVPDTARTRPRSNRPSDPLAARKVVAMTVDNAKKYMKNVGHTGELLVYDDPQTFYNNCAKDHVCAYAPSSGIGTGDRVTLMINK
jgi:hypothetical protein